MSAFELVSTTPLFKTCEFAKTIMESLQTLRRLKLTIIVLFPDQDLLVGICDELEEISGRNKLECIETYLEVWYEDKMDEWHRLEEVLIKSGWPELKCVSITITFLCEYANMREPAPPFENKQKD